MKHLRPLFLALIVAVITATSTPAFADGKEELHRESSVALAKLIEANPAAAEISKKAKAALIFPNIVKAGLVFGGAYGEGVLQKGSMIDGYYNSITASFGWQAGAQSYGYVVFLMNDEAIKYLKDTKGWEFGVGPTVAIIDEGAAKNLSTTSLQDDAYAFIFDQQGLMASLSIEGTKITEIKQP